MRLPMNSRSRTASAVALLVAGLMIVGCSDRGTQPTSPDADIAAVQEFGPAFSAQESHGPDLMKRNGVLGSGVGLNEDGEPSLVLYLAAPGIENIPDHVDGVPVERVVTGLIVAGADPTTRARPAPVGFSVGHPDITAGTYGAKVTDGTDVYMLSNNHVLANSNAASIGDATLQPGPSDGGSDPADRIGTLADYQTISFSSDNVMDAAIASPTHPDSISASTPSDAYGVPGTSVTDANVGLAVQKYGRTTGHTTGTVEEVNVSISVCYEPAGPFNCKSAATFVDQIGIGPGTFSDGGDSGSLIVTDDSNADPVGLLFAGGSDRTFANPIGDVLNRFGVSIDDGSGGGDTNSAPTASFTSSCTDLSCSFDGSGSSDSDGSIASYEWDFGDGNTATGQTASHTYASGGTYTVTLTVTDDDGATDSSSQDVSVSSSTAGGFHVGDLDGGQSSQGRTWTATVTVTAHDDSHNAEEGSTVSFSYSGRDVSGTDSCTTGTDGTCTITVSNIRKRTGSVTFEVTDLADSDGSYDSSSNHDPDADSDGTTITVNKP